MLNWMSKTVHALPILDSQESDFMLGRTAVPHLHDIGKSFDSYQNENLVLVQLPG